MMRAPSAFFSRFGEPRDHNKWTGVIKVSANGFTPDRDFPRLIRENAIAAYRAAREEWLKHERRQREIAAAQIAAAQGDKAAAKARGQGLPADIEMFFLFASGEVYESGHAFRGFRRRGEDARDIGLEMLPAEHPLMGMAFSLVGSAHFHLAEFDLAADALTEALSVRERCFGPRSPETAVVMNNIGACRLAQHRILEALRMFTMANSILTSSLGHDHPRNVIVVSNIETELKTSPTSRRELREL
eukprot:tig00020944_g16362.t1